MSKFLFVLDINFSHNGPSNHLLYDIIFNCLNRNHYVDIVMKVNEDGFINFPDNIKNNKKVKFMPIVDENKKGSFTSRYFDEVKYAKKCYKLFSKQGSYNSIFLQSNNVPSFYMRWLKKLKIPVLFNVQDIFPYNLKLSKQLPLSAFTFPIFRYLQKKGYKYASKIVTISDDMKNTLIKDGVKSDKIAVVYNWSYSDSPIIFDDIDEGNVFHYIDDKKKFNVLYAGNIGKMQNVELIIEAAKKMNEINDVHFYIIGNGSSREAIKNEATDLTNVSIIDSQKSKYAESIYSSADLILIPLVTGGIKTALPSKTATCLRTIKPIVFCLDSDSVFAKMCMNFPGVSTTDSLNAVNLVNNILYWKDNYSLLSEKEIKERTHFCEKNNSLKYVNLLEEISISNNL